MKIDENYENYEKNGNNNKVARNNGHSFSALWGL